MPKDDPQDLTLEGLVHDLNNIFETIADAADVLKRDPRNSRIAATIERSVNRGARILASFFEQSQASLDVDLILDGATEFASDFLSAAKRPRLEFQRNIEAGTRLRGNPGAWERVFVNLFLNAAQAMADEGGVVSIKATRGPDGVDITVSDNGSGISPKILPRIFEPGFTTRGKRSGLGLHIVRTIVEQHGGSISAANRADSPGAEFRIRLPQ